MGALLCAVETGKEPINCARGNLVSLRLTQAAIESAKREADQAALEGWQESSLPPQGGSSAHSSVDREHDSWMTVPIVLIRLRTDGADRASQRAISAAPSSTMKLLS